MIGATDDDAPAARAPGPASRPGPGPGPGSGGLPALDPAVLDELVQLRTEFTRFMLAYQFGIEEMTTKVSILRQEFLHLHEHNPIEHVSSRLKSPESITAKIARKESGSSFEAIRAAITDIAGLRVTCSFESDVYRVADLLTRQADVTVLEVKDYIARPKPNGYRSLHVIASVPVFLSEEVVPVTVELQLRTVAMDFWASLEHKIHYKYDRDVPEEVREGLLASARTAAELDSVMEDLHRRVHGDPADRPPRAGAAPPPGATASDAVPSDAVLERLRRIRDGAGDRRGAAGPVDAGSAGS